MSDLPASGFLTPREIISRLSDGQTYIMHNGATIGAQVSRKGETYYVCGPEAGEVGVDLEAVFRLEASEGGAVAGVNKIIAEELPDAQIFICQGLADAIKTLDGLFTAAR